jgi:hypothetical protein
MWEALRALPALAAVGLVLGLLTIFAVEGPHARASYVLLQGELGSLASPSGSRLEDSNGRVIPTAVQVSYSYVTTTSAANLRSYYEEQLQAHGWQECRTTVSVDGLDVSVVFHKSEYTAEIDFPNQVDPGKFDVVMSWNWPQWGRSCQ